MGKPKLTIGMATYEDYDGVFFTINAINMYHPGALEQVEILVVDNYPEGKHGEALAKYIAAWVPNARYTTFTERRSTSIKNCVFERALADYVLCVDSHVLLVPGSVGRLIEYFDRHPDSSDLLQGPLVYDNLKGYASHFNRVWCTMMLGVWGEDPRAQHIDAEPFEILFQGTGLFACRKAAWLGFCDLYQGFGGEEWYIHEKFRQHGHKVLCLPFLRWLHRFGKIGGITYPNRLEDRVYNYLVGFLELGLPIDEILEHFSPHLQAELLEQTIARAKNDYVFARKWIKPKYDVPLVSCVMLASGHSQDSVEESVESFLKQHYPSKELIIFNDDRYTIQYDHELVKVINYPQEGLDIDAAIGLAAKSCNGTLICIWDANIVSLPWRLSTAIDALVEGSYWQPSACWKNGPNGLYISTFEDMLAGIFPKTKVGSPLLNLAACVTNADDLDPDSASFILRSCQQHDNTDMVLKPHWNADYVHLVQDAASRISKTLTQRSLVAFVWMRNLLTWPRATLSKLESLRVRPILVDCGSTYQPLLEFYTECPYEVIRLDQKFKSLSQTDVFRDTDGLCLLVDPRFDIIELPEDTLDKMRSILHRTGTSQCGVSVIFEDVPDTHPRYLGIVEEQRVHYSRPVLDDLYDTSAGQAFTLAAMPRPEDDGSPQFRLRAPYHVRFRPWYLDFTQLDEELLYYVQQELGPDFEAYKACP